MNTIKKLSTLLLVTILSQVASAQIKGTVLDENGEPFPFANVLLLSASDSSYVSGCITSDDGRFTLSENLVKNKPYILKVSFIGYTTQYQNVMNPSDVGTLTLAENATMLQGVEVKVNRPKTYVTADALVTNVEGTVLEKTGDVYDMLKHVTGVTVMNEDITVIGAGTPQVYVNGRLVRDKDDLHHLMADQVQKVEVVNSPGARYDATVPAVIRITKKKEAGDGFRMDLKGTGAYLDGADGWSATTSDMVGYRKNGFDATLRYSNFFGEGQEISHELQEMFGNSTLSDENTNYNELVRRSHTFSTELNYEFDADNSVGIRYDVDFAPNVRINGRSLSALSENQTLQENSQTLTSFSKNSSSHYINLYYVGLQKGWSIDFNADAYLSKETRWQSSKSTWHTTANEDGADEIHSHDKAKNLLLAGKIIAEHSLWGGSLSFGAEASYTNHFDAYKEEVNKLPQSETKMIEDNEAAFVEYKRAIGPVMAQAGLRYEHVGSNYYVFGEHQKDQSRQYHNVFPRLNLSLPVKDFNFSLAYRNTIERPHYDYLSSTIEYFNKNLYSQGNPYLKPAIEHKVTFNAAYKWVTLTAIYNNVRNSSAWLLSEYQPGSTVMLLKWQNIEPYNAVSFSIDLNPTIKFWTPDLGVSFSKQWYKMDFCGAPLYLNRPHLYVYFTNMFDLKHNWYLEASYYYSSRCDSFAYRYTSNNHYLGFNIRKGFLNDNLQFTLSADNLLGTKLSTILYGSVSRVESRLMNHQREISLTVRYKFNSALSKYMGSGAGEGQKNRM